MVWPDVVYLRHDIKGVQPSVGAHKKISGTKLADSRVFSGFLHIYDVLSGNE